MKNYEHLHKKAFEIALSLMPVYETLTDPLKAGGEQAGIPYGDPMKTFVEYAMARIKDAQPPTKLQQLKDLMARGAWREALALAARFPDLGKHRNQIIDAHEAYARPDWYRQIKRDPDKVIAEGIEALKERYT